MPAYRHARAPRRRTRRRVTARALTVALVAASGLAGLTATAQATGDPSERTGTAPSYVALGDSYAAGPGIPPQRPGSVPGCARSASNYPSVLATTLKLTETEFVDVSCSGAVTDDMTVAQQVPGGANPPQFDALRPGVRLVSVSIGGNDIGFADIVVTCARLSARNPLGAPCRQDATSGGSDRYAERILAAAPKVAAVLDGIHERSPGALVVLVGYLRILPPAGGCWPAVPVARGDVPYLDGLQQQLTSMLATQAKEHSALFVDAYAASTGRDACEPRDRRWVEGLVPANPAAPVHPNAAGMRAVADLTMRTLVDSLD